MARTFGIAFTVLVALLLVTGSPASATAPQDGASGIAAAATPESPPAPDGTDSSEEEAWRGDVPIKGVIGGTAALLGVLTVVAVRREWLI